VYPKSMLGFLQPGTQIGIRYDESRANVYISILSEGVFDVLMDAKELSITELVAKHPLAKEGYEKHLKEFLGSPKSGRDSKTALADIGNRQITISQAVFQLYPMTILTVGEDYFLAEHGLGSKKKIVFPKTVINRVSWLEEVDFSSHEKPRPLVFGEGQLGLVSPFLDRKNRSLEQIGNPTVHSPH